jgi:hypothetical protein
MHKSATKCNETIGKWCKNKHGASKIIDTFETYQSPRRHNSPRHRSGRRQSRTPSPRRHRRPKYGGTRRSRSPNKTYDYEDDEKEMGASCFTHRVRTTPVPKGFKLPHDQEKYDGSQEPQSWLSDYLQAVKILVGTM